MPRPQHLPVLATCRFHFGAGFHFAVLVLCLALGFAEVHAASPSVQSLIRGEWVWPSGIAFDVKVVGRYAYVAGGPGGLAVIDVSDPANCVRVGTLDSSDTAFGVAVSGNFAYMAMNGFQVVNIGSPSNCVLVGHYFEGGDIRDVAVVGNRAYLAIGVAGLQVIDVSNPTNCIRLGGLGMSSGPGVGVAVSGHYAYVAESWAGLQVYDVSNPTNIVRVGGYSTSGYEYYAYRVAVSGNYAYVANGYSGLQVIDVTNPTNCVRVGGYNTGGLAVGVTVSGNYAYVADYDGGLEVIDVSNPTLPMRVGGTDTSGLAFGVAVAADRIYVADARAGLLVLPTVRDFQFTVRVDAETNMPFTLEAATDLSAPMPWTPLVTTNVPVMPFDFVDFDVKLTNKPQKFYRVRQP